MSLRAASSRKRSWGTEDRRRRVSNGAGDSWPTHGARVTGQDAFHPGKRRVENQGRAPGRPAIMFLYEDLNAIGEPPEGVFGMYPSTFIPKILPWLRCERRRIVHVCSGGLPPGEGIRVDVAARARPDVMADGRHLPFRSGSVDAVLLDPPYTEHYARDLYGTDYPRPSHLLREAARVVKPCGRIGFVHHITPNPPPLCHVVKVFGMSVGYGFPMRAVTIFEREQDALMEAM